MVRSVILKVIILAIVVISGCSQATNSNIAVKTNPVEMEENQVLKESLNEDQGFDDIDVQSIEEEIKKNHPKILSFLIMKNDNIIYEKYYNGRNKDTPTGVFSINKSILSALTGIAIEMGFLTDLDQQISSLLPKYIDEQSDSRKKEITIRHLLTMTGGLEAVDKDIGSWFQSKDWLAYALDQPMTHEPGDAFVYNTGLSHILSGVLTEATGMTTKDFADQYLLGPLNITNYKWDKTPEGIYVGGTNFFLTPRDMAKFGQLYLNHGKWEEEQVVPQAWVEASTQQQIEDAEYGYMFWIKNMTDSNERELFTYEANGYGGQHIRIIPELDTVIVITSDHLAPISSDTHQLLDMFIVPALY